MTQLLRIKVVLNKSFTIQSFQMSRYFTFMILWLGVSLVFTNCKTNKPTTSSNDSSALARPDYSNLKYWAAHPDKADEADKAPSNVDFKNSQADSEVDVFFLHPTTLLKSRVWNGDVNNEKLNSRTDKSAIRFQASVFNSVGRIYAPRYRQAHIYSYFTKDTVRAMKAFDLAYEDVKAAFQYYLEHWNNGRPIIIASHSQGTTHAKRLLKEFFDEKNLKNRLVIAYLLGMPIKKDEYTSIPPCATPEQTGCFCSWRTFKKDYRPRGLFPMGENIAVTNPLSWTNQTEWVNREKHKGFVLMDFKASEPHKIDAQVYNGILWITKPRFKWSFLYRSKNYHVGDFNLFYLNIQEDAKRRIGLFWK